MEKSVPAYLFYWYLDKTPRDILKAWRNILWFNLEYFSVAFLLRTLFAPWRRTAWGYGKGFNIGRWFEVVTGNIISRVLGFIIRTALIIAGLLAELGLVVLAPIVFICWFLFPLFLLYLLYQGVFVMEFPDFGALLFLATFFIGTFWLVRSFWQSYKDAKPLAQTNTLAEFLKKEQGILRFVFNRLLLNPKDVIRLLREQEKAVPANFPELSEGKETPEEVLIAAAQNHKGFQKVLVQFNVSAKDVKAAALWLLTLRKKIEDRKQWWSRKNLRKKGTLGRQWTSGFSPLLDQYSYDLTQEAKMQGFLDMIGHKQEIEAVERVLARDQINNVLLVGQPGSGRKSIVREMAKRSLLGETFPELSYKRVVELDIPALLSSTQTTFERETALGQIFHEVIRAGNIILVISDFHNFVGGTAQRPGTIDVSGILSKYLSSPQFPIIAVTTFRGLHRDIEQNPSLLSLLEKVEVQEISEKEAALVLQGIVPFFERKYKVLVSYQALTSIVSLSQKYIQALPLPKKALDVLDESMVQLAQAGERVLLPKHVSAVISEKTQIPVGDLEAKEKETLLNLEDLIHKRIINQEEAVKEISSSLRRARTQIGSRKGPMGSFLFLGPTGVGKTETAKALAAIYFGSEQRMIRLDMSEFQNVKDIDRLLGSPGQEGLLTTQVRENPFALVLLDELEKAHGNILNLFLQVLDEGHITDGMGRKVDFAHTIIIATSNAGYQIILQALKEKADFTTIKQKIFDHLFAEGIFRPEFLNRFDAVVLFQPLSEQHLVDIAGLMLSKVEKNLKEKGIALNVTDPLKAKIAKLGYNPQFGARDMRRVIQDKIENTLAEALLRGTVKRGETIEIDPEEFEVRKIS